MTYLEIINKVLLRLREDTVSTSTESSYSKLIGDFVKQAAEEVSSAWSWASLSGEAETVAVSAGDSSFTIGTSPGDNGKGNIEITSVYNVTEDVFLSRWNAKKMQSWHDANSDTADREQPTWFASGGNDSSGVHTIYIAPISDGSYSLKVRWIKKYDPDYTYSDSTEITLPTLPVFLRSLALAISERGEDGGALSSEVDAQYISALADAISLEVSNDNYDELSWRVM